MSAPEPQQLPAYAERVIDLVDRVPPGRVVSYGDVAELLEEGGPRLVGRVLARYGGLTTWWRVVRSDGALPRGLEQQARERHAAEGTALVGGRVDMRRARWDGRRAPVSDLPGELSS